MRSQGVVDVKRKEMLYLDAPGLHKPDAVMNAMRSHAAIRHVKYVVVSRTTGESPWAYEQLL